MTALETRSRRAERACPRHPHPSSEALSGPQTEWRCRPLSEMPPARLFAFRFDRARLACVGRGGRSLRSAPPGSSAFWARATWSREERVRVRSVSDPRAPPTARSDTAAARRVLDTAARGAPPQSSRLRCWGRRAVGRFCQCDVTWSISQSRQTLAASDRDSDGEGWVQLPEVKPQGPVLLGFKPLTPRSRAAKMNGC